MFSFRETISKPACQLCRTIIITGPKFIIAKRCIVGSLKLRSTTMTKFWHLNVSPPSICSKQSCRVPRWKNGNQAFWRCQVVFASEASTIFSHRITKIPLRRNAKRCVRTSHLHNVRTHHLVGELIMRVIFKSALGSIRTMFNGCI